ncbi:MAG: asparagine synthase (glutamine-hydrolyzing) [Clostridiales bacterium]|nr:asparagine synthase (glutamine-hydrolyzing) [Clostridiales bacterium]
MCGIAGVIDYSNDTREYKNIYAEMIKRLSRRGPDANDMYLSGNASLLHARLAVVDIENGKQPMRAGNCVITYNGELYNTQELRNHLIAFGHTFETESDTEVLLHGYLEWGDKVVDKLNGIYAFAIWDEMRKNLFIARDRMGVKPFFYAIMGHKFIFGSEIKAILAHPSVPPNVDKEGLADVMLIAPGRTPGKTPFKYIKELKPGECGYIDRNGLHKRRYWRILPKAHTQSFEETIEVVRYLLKDSIKRQTIADVPLCSFLSGGLDSSAIVALSDVKNTFSVDYAEDEKYYVSNKFEPSSDRDYIDIMVKVFGLNHKTVMLTADDLVDGLFEATRARDLPGMADVDSSLLLFAREVKKNATVALSGECADEIFGGYPWYRDGNILNRQEFPWSNNIGYRAGFIKQAALEGIDPAEYVQKRYQATCDEAKGLESDDQQNKRIREMFMLNTNWFMQTLLDRKDRCTMYSGLEGRVPFCDHRIAEYLYNVPWDFKNYKDREKGLLRESLEGILPKEILWRKKSPYPKTHHPAYYKRVSSILGDIICNLNSPLLDVVDKKALENLLKTKDTGERFYGQLMTVPQTIAFFIQFNEWLLVNKVKFV